LRYVLCGPSDTSSPPPTPAFYFTSNIACKTLFLLIFVLSKSVGLTNNGSSSFAGCHWRISYAYSYRLILFFIRWLVHKVPIIFLRLYPISFLPALKVAWKTLSQHLSPFRFVQTSKILRASARVIASLAIPWERVLSSALQPSVQAHCRQSSQMPMRSVRAYPIVCQ
jgi:hypothetical protein